MLRGCLWQQEGLGNVGRGDTDRGRASVPELDSTKQPGELREHRHSRAKGHQTHPCLVQVILGTLKVCINILMEPQPAFKWEMGPAQPQKSFFNLLQPISRHCSSSGAQHWKRETPMSRLWL